MHFALAAAAVLAAAAPAPAVLDIDRDGYAELLAASRGRPLVVNMWATWCGPCRTEFPELVKIHRELGPRGLAMASISMDTPSALEKEVIPFLTKQGAGFPCYVKSPGDDDAFINTVNPDWSGALPATFIYDSDGNLVTSLMKVTTYEQLEEILTPLLAGEK